MKIYLWFFVIFLNTDLILGQAPPWLWAQEANTNGIEYAWEVTHDNSSGNVYIGGTFDTNLSAKYGVSFTSTYGQDDGFLAKYTNTGIFQWALKIGGTNSDQVKGVAVDPSGDVYVCGYFTGTADFDPSASTFSLSSAGGKDGFLAKYTSAGLFLWAVNYGGAGDDEPWKMFADVNGVYLTGYYVTSPAVFNSYGSVITKTTSSNAGNAEVFGAKYNASGVAQWVISGGGSKVDCGYNVVADANNVYFIGVYNSDIIFRNASGTASAVLQQQQNNKQQVFIIAYTQAGAYVWQNNITCSQGGKDVVGWTIAQDVSNLYVSGYLEGDINFKWPSPTLTQTIIGGGGFDIFLAKLSKAGTFIWRTPVTGSGNGEQIGRALEVDNAGNVILSGNFKTGLDYSSVGGPAFTASGADIFVTSYSNTGAFQWSVKAGNTGDDLVNGSAVDNTGGIYIAGDHANGAIFGAYSLTPGSASSNIYVAKLGCDPLNNNTVTANQTLCSGNAPTSLTGSIPTGSGPYAYVWEQSSNNITWVNAAGTFTNQNYAPLTLTVSTYFRRTVNVTGACANTLSSSSILITVNQPPTASNAGTTQTVCANTATLNANTPVTGTGLWTVVTGTSSITNASLPNSSVTGLSNGTNKFVWTISNGVCPVSASTVTVTRDVPPTVSNAGTVQTVCASTATLNANTPVTGTGVWTVVTGTASVVSPASSNSPLTGLSNGTNKFVWTISNGVCPVSTSTVTVTRDIPPTVSNAGTTQTVCASNATLNANTPVTGTGVWTVITGTSSVASPAASNSPVTGLSNGTNNFVWTISNGVCPASASTVTVTRDVSPTVSNAGITQILCASTATLNANAPAIGVGLWTVITGTSSVTTPASSNSSVTGLNNGTNQFVWTISNGVCPASTSTVTVTNDVPPSVSNAGTTQTLCASTATLNANAPVTGTGVWTVITGTSSVTTPASSNSSVTGLSNGTNNFVWTISNGVCPASASTVTVNRDVSPTISNAGATQTVCSTTATLNANTPAIGTGLWTVITGTASVTSASSHNSPVTGLSYGMNQFVWSISNGSCPASTSTVTVNNNVPPSLSNTGSSQTLCAVTTTLNANTPLTGVGLWSVLSGNASFLAANNPSTTASLFSIGQNILAWTISNGVCAPSTSTVSIYVEQTPSVADAGPDIIVCAQASPLNAIMPLVGIGSWAVLSGTGNITQVNSYSTSVNSLSTGQNIVVWTVINGTCPSSSDTLIILRDSLPTLANAGADQLICTNNSLLNANSPVTGSGLWSSLSGNSFSSPTIASSPVTNLNPGNNSLIWTITNGSCPASKDTVIIKVDAEPSVSFAGNDLRICSDQTTLSATPLSVGTGSWSLVSGTGIFLNPTQYNSLLTSVSSGTTILRWTTKNGICPDKSDDIVIVRDLMPDTAHAGSDQSTDNPATKLTAINPLIGTGRWSVIEGTGVIENAYNVTTNTTLSEGDNTFRWTIENGVCPSNYDDILVYAKPLMIPNAFSPNDDGVNDFFIIPGITYYEDVKFTVFNRWGALIYSNSNYKNTWNGVNVNNEIISEDTYYYTLQMNRDKVYTGFIIVKRGK